MKIKIFSCYIRYEISRLGTEINVWLDENKIKEKDVLQRTVATTENHLIVTIWYKESKVKESLK